MTQSQNELLAKESIDKLVTLVEEATRATVDSPKRFVEPARGTLDRAKSKRHHLVFGRRGSGKTSILRKAQADLSLQRIPVAFIDLEAFKGHEYPDVLLSVLIETLNSFDSWLASAATSPASKRRFWTRMFGGKPTSPPLNHAKVQEVRVAVARQTEELRHLLNAEDDASIKTTVEDSQSSTTDHGASVEGGLRAGGASIRASLAEKQRGDQKQSRESTEETTRSKIRFLHRRIIDFQALLQRIVDLASGDAYIFLDDLYHIPRKDQASVLDYFHRIVKGRRVWLKIGTIRHRTDWYRHGDPPIGMKLGDDCDDIDLDITLEKYEIARSFLLQILDQLCQESGVTAHGELLADGAIERLVLASGGVARDFLTIFRRAIEVARERGKTYRGSRINAEDVNVAAGEHDTAKRDELKRDTQDERIRLEAALKHIQAFCIKNLVNCFLVERDVETVRAQVLGELVDLRFVHVVESRTTVREEKGKLYTAYMLDISQYTGERRRRELEIIQFWKRSELDRIRARRYVLNLDDAIKEPPESAPEAPVTEDGSSPH